MSFFSQIRYFNQRLALACSLVALSSFNYGFDNQGFATTQAMDAFDKRFGVLNPKTHKYALETYWLSLFNSLNYIGFAAGLVIGSFISTKWGRRWCMFLMSCYALITATITITSMNREQILAARILNYVYVGMELSVVPTYQSEIVPASARGLIVGTYQFSLIFGGMIVNAVCRGTSGIQDDRAWRIPLGLFYIVPSIVGSLIWFLPESPRWLLINNRKEESKESLRQLREGKFSEDEIETEFRELQLALEEEFERGRFAELFQGVNLKRTLVIIGLNFFQQATGQAFASQYGTIYVKSLGTINPFNFTLIVAAVNIVTLALVLLATDKLGRKIPMIASSILMVIALFTMGGLGTASPVTRNESVGIVSMIALMACGFSIGWGPLTYVVSTELPALRLRDHSIRLGFFVNILMNFVVTFSLPYLLNAPYAGLHSKVGFIFGSLAALSLVFVIFFVPECKGKTLEQIDMMFQRGVKLMDFGKLEGKDFIDNVGEVKHFEDVDEGTCSLGRPKGTA